MLVGYMEMVQAMMHYSAGLRFAPNRPMKIQLEIRQRNEADINKLWNHCCEMHTRFVKCSASYATLKRDHEPSVYDI